METQFKITARAEVTIVNSARVMGSIEGSKEGYHKKLIETIFWKKIVLAIICIAKKLGDVEKLKLFPDDPSDSQDVYYEKRHLGQQKNCVPFYSQSRSLQAEAWPSRVYCSHLVLSGKFTERSRIYLVLVNS